MGRESDSPARKGARVARRRRRSPPPGMRSSEPARALDRGRAVGASHSLHRVERKGSRQPPRVRAPVDSAHGRRQDARRGRRPLRGRRARLGSTSSVGPRHGRGRGRPPSTACARRPGAYTSMGRIPTREYVMQLFGDVVVHGWDLARAVGADERLDSRAPRGGVWLLQAPRAHPARLRAVRQARRYAHCCRHPNQASRAARPKGIVE